MSAITRVEQLEAIYGQPGETSTVKEVDRITPEYRVLIEASPFVALATAGPEGLDCSPRGDKESVVRIDDAHTVLMPDRRGNNRIDSLRNIVRDPRVGLLFLIPGVGMTIRINGLAELHVDSDLCDSFAVDGKPPRCVIKIAVHALYFQCARAIVRSDLWNPERFHDPAHLPTPGKLLASLSNETVGGAAYDLAWPARAKATMW